MAAKAFRPTHILMLGAACLLSGAILGFLLRAPAPAPAVTPDPAPKPVLAALSSGSATRMTGYSFVRPLMECDLEGSPDPLNLRSLRESLVAEIGRHASRSGVQHVSLYLRDLASTAVLGINEDEGFSPASLLKVPIMMTALRVAERTPNFLERSLVFNVPPDAAIPQTIAPRKALDMGGTYTLWALVEQMISESDNRAMAAVGEQLNPKDYLKTYEDIGLRPPRIDGTDPSMSVAEYASFFRILYNATYLGPAMSERALGLLTRVSFDRGLVAGVGRQVPVAHKFGERRLNLVDGSSVNQLHDCGVVYYPGRPFLLCVMTRGNDWDALASTIKDLTAGVYHHYEVVAQTLAQGAQGAQGGPGGPSSPNP